MALIGRLATKWWAVAVMLALILGIAYGLALDWTVQGYDDANYILLARSLASGEGYRVGEGRPPFATTPMLPFLLAPLWLLNPPLPHGVILFKLVPLACTLLSVLVLLHYLTHARQVPLLAAAAIVLLTLLSPATFTYAARLVMTELPYLLFSALALCLAHRLFLAGKGSRWQWPALALALAAACLTRTVGLTLLAACLGFLLWRCRWKDALGLGLVVALLLVPWQVYVRAQDSAILAPDQYQSDFLLRDYNHQELGQIESYWEVAPRLLRNVVGHLDESLPSLFMPALTGPNILGALQRLNLGWFRIAFGFFFVLVTCLGWGIALRRGSTPLEWYLPVYLLMILLPPWYAARNLVPIAPFLLFYLWSGFDGSQRWLQSHSPSLEQSARWAVVVLFAAMAISTVASDRHKIRQGVEARAGRFPADEESYYRAGDWLRENLPASASVAAPAAYRMALYIDHPVEGLPLVANDVDPAAVEGFVADYVVVQPGRPTVKYESPTAPAIEAFVRSHPERCTLVFASDLAPRAEIYRCTGS